MFHLNFDLRTWSKMAVPAAILDSVQLVIFGTAGPILTKFSPLSHWGYKYVPPKFWPSNLIEDGGASSHLGFSTTCNISETAGPILTKFRTSSHWGYRYLLNKLWPLNLIQDGGASLHLGFRTKRYISRTAGPYTEHCCIVSFLASGWFMIPVYPQL